jgi:hypothetical protein
MSPAIIFLNKPASDLSNQLSSDLPAKLILDPAILPEKYVLQVSEEVARSAGNPYFLFTNEFSPFLTL